MFARLIGSAPGQQKGTSASGASLMLHATLLGLAIHFSAGESAPREPDETLQHVIYTPVYDPAHKPIPGVSGETPVPCECALPPFPVPNTSIVVPTGIPAALPDPGPPIVSGRGNPAPAAGGDGEGGVFAPTVDVATHALPGNPRPAYPSLLRNAHVEGLINVLFVVDSTGRVDTRSISFEPRAEPLFESAVRRALLASRYEPARAGGRPVEMRVEQEFAFRITP